MDGDEHEIAVGEPYVVRGVAVEQIVVDVERIHADSAAANEDLPEASVVRWAARSVQSAECGTGT